MAEEQQASPQQVPQAVRTPPPEGQARQRGAQPPDPQQDGSQSPAAPHTLEPAAVEWERYAAALVKQAEL